MQQDTHTRNGKDSPTYLDPQMMTMTIIQTEKAKVMKYLVRTMRYYKEKKEMLIVPYNTGSHWVLYTISMRHIQVWYCDSNRLIDPANGKRGTCDYSEVMAVFNK
jgi:pyridoxine/pyridoxamine 5'-phosphate oxidase